MTSLTKIPQQTLFFLDWDDTLHASTFFTEHEQKNKKLDEKIQIQLSEFEKSLVTFLNSAIKIGKVHVVTNAEVGWVQLSAAKFLPNILPLLNNIPIISARSMFESIYPDSPVKWKFFVFQWKIQSHLFDSKTSTITNIISIGDSYVEREAIRTVTKKFKKTHTKSIKFCEKPNIDQLHKQIMIISQSLKWIHEHDGDLDLLVTIEDEKKKN